MQFISNGPDIPDELLQAHEEGQVVFFCGAGISYPAGLPGFSGLVDEVYKACGDNPSELEKEAYNKGQFDTTLDLLEQRITGGRRVVRKALANSLKPKLRRKGATDTHQALLTLARSRDNALRLVTTNFDRVFHAAGGRMGIHFQNFEAPTLPIPKNSRWNGLVFLHGLLQKKPDDETLNDLVLTSGDFGLAYLTERWAARFVTDLFKNYVVCFVGYSINDPVMRYMMDALAADHRKGEAAPKVWAFGDYSPGEEDKRSLEWKAKGVTPILYEAPSTTNDHSKLHQTLKMWAEVYRDGAIGKEQIVLDSALAHPSKSTQQDNFVGRMLWALSDSSGLPAKRFAELRPTPPLDWLFEAFTVENFGSDDLKRFNITTANPNRIPLGFSLINRPTPYELAPWMKLTGATRDGQWDKVMNHLATWSMLHLNDPRLIIWVAKQGGRLHERFAFILNERLSYLASLAKANNQSELNIIQKQAPNAIPEQKMLTLWQLFLNNRIKSSSNHQYIFEWSKRLNDEAIDITQRLQFRNLFEPQLVIREPFSWGQNQGEKEFRQLVDWELVLASDHIYSAIEDKISDFPIELLDDAQQLLRDALDIQSELDGASEHSDKSTWDLPSIEPHFQNRHYHDWVILIEILRELWLKLFTKDKNKAITVAHNWFNTPYPTFKRLALYSASKTDCIEPKEWVNWLLSDDCIWLWSTCTGREVFRLIVLQGKNLIGRTQQRLEDAILSGPPRAMYRDDLEEDEWDDLTNRSIWLHLSKLKESGITLGRKAKNQLATLTLLNPKWKLQPNEQDEFSHWMSGTGDPDFDESVEIIETPTEREELVKWLKENKPISSPFYEDRWREVCTKYFQNSLSALQDLAKEGIWPKERWREAFNAWNDPSLLAQSWEEVTPTIKVMPDDLLLDIIHSLSRWIEKASELADLDEDLYFFLCRKILNLDLTPESGITTNGSSADHITAAINHPVGHITQGLINILFKKKPNDNDLLPHELKSILTELSNPQKPMFVHARVLLCSRLLPFFRIDQNWVEESLLPLFDWKTPIEAKGAWAGYLWSPRLYQPLMVAFKAQFLECTNHYQELGDSRSQLVTIMTYAALNSLDGYALKDFQTAIRRLPKEGLETCARALSQALEGAGEQREQYWEYRIKPFWQEVWPKSSHIASEAIAESIARISIASGSLFPSAFAETRDWLQKIEHPDYVIRLLNNSNLCEKFPNESLELMSAIISDQNWIPSDLNSCLASIKQANQELVQTSSYRRLYDYSRK